MLRRKKNEYAMRLPPLWWIKRRIRVNTMGEQVQAWYQHGNRGWGVTSDSVEDAVEGLLDTMRGVKDGSTLKEYYTYYED